MTALVQDSFEAMDAAVDDITAEDPIERIWEAVTISVAANCRYVPKPVVAAVLADAELHRGLARRWPGRELILDAIRSATEAGDLCDDLSPELLVEQAGSVFFYLLGSWAAEERDEQALTAGVLHAFDVCLLAVARPRHRARARLLEHAVALEPLCVIPSIHGESETPPDE